MVDDGDGGTVTVIIGVNVDVEIDDDENADVSEVVEDVEVVVDVDVETNAVVVGDVLSGGSNVGTLEGEVTGGITKDRSCPQNSASFVYNENNSDANDNNNYDNNNNSNEIISLHFATLKCLHKSHIGKFLH